MYDPLALGLCSNLRRRFFTVEKDVKGVKHTVIGISKDEPGIADDKVKELRDFLYRGFFKGTTLNFSSYTKLDADTMCVCCCPFDQMMLHLYSFLFLGLSGSRT